MDVHGSTYEWNMICGHAHDYNHYCGCMYITLQPLLNQEWYTLVSNDEGNSSNRSFRLRVYRSL